MFHLIRGRRTFQFMIAVSREKTRDCFLLFKSSSLKFVSSVPSPRPYSLTVSYLVYSCGLSPEAALSVSKKVNLKTTGNADSVLELLRGNGFTDAQIAKMVCKCPSLLASDPLYTLLPRIDAFKRHGISGPDLTKIVCSNPFVFKSSAEKKIDSCFYFLKSILRSDENVLATLRRSSRLLQANLEAYIAPNMSIMLKNGVPESNIVNLMICYPRTLLLVPKLFSEIVSFIRGMNFDPLIKNFTSAIRVISSMKSSNWERKLDVYTSLGWSKEDLISAFKLQPKCMLKSEKKIMKVANFIHTEMGWSPTVLSKCPNLLLYSLEKRTIPRCLLLKFLIAKGLIEDDIRLIWMLNLSEKQFMEKTVVKYEITDPEIMRPCQMQVALLDFAPTSVSQES